jgi:DNA-binding winged helix-turn-helix (wHTH) protein
MPDRPANVAFARPLSLAPVKALSGAMGPALQNGAIATWRAAHAWEHSMSKSAARGAVCFDHYRFEPQTARLWLDEREVKLTRKAAAVLGVLVACAGRPVTKAELFASVWSDRVVSDDALTTCIQELRRALGDDPRRPRYIETRHRYGYRFVAALSPAVEVAAAAPGVALGDVFAIQDEIARAVATILRRALQLDRA